MRSTAIPCTVVVLVRGLYTPGARGAGASYAGVPADSPDQLTGGPIPVPAHQAAAETIPSASRPVLPVHNPHVVLVAGTGQPRDLAVEIDQIITIGRSNENTLWFDEEEVSRSHAFIKRDTRELTITDLHSTNGTFVNGQRVRRAVLRLGDRVELGGAAAALMIQSV